MRWMVDSAYRDHDLVFKFEYEFSSSYFFTLLYDGRWLDFQMSRTEIS